MPDVSVVSPINVDKLALQLCNHPDRNKVEYVLSGFRYGFRLGFNPDAVSLKSAKANYPSAFEHLSIVDNYLAKEVSLGRVSGPLKATALDGLQISRFGVIPKDGGWRSILIDLFLSTDASGSTGYGVFYSGEWFNGSWSVAQQSQSIAYKEFFPIVLSCCVWGDRWRNLRVQFNCDNQRVVAIINSGTSTGCPKKNGVQLQISIIQR